MALLSSSIIHPIIQRTSNLFKLPYSLTILIYTILTVGTVYIFFNSLSTSFEPLFHSTYEAIKIFTENMQESEIAALLFQNIEAILQKIFQYITTFSTNIVQSIFDIFLFTFAFFFSLFECRKDRFWYFIYVPPTIRKKWKPHFQTFVQLFTTFLSIEMRLMLITFFIVGLSFKALQFEHPFQKALLIAIADLLPFFGIGLILLPTATFFYMQKQLTITVALLILYICVLVIRQIAESYFWSAKIKIRTVHSFFISAGAVLIFGIYGLLMIPVLFMVAIHYRKRFSDG